MSFSQSLRSAHRRAVIAAVLCAVAPGVQAQQQASSDNQGFDHTMVVARTVQPRIAYRGIALQDNPVRVQATTFPGRVFHQSVDASMERLLGDGELAQFGSLGIDRSATGHRARVAGLPGAGNPVMLGGAASATATPLGGGMVAGGAMSAATRSLGSLIQSSLLPIVGASNGGGE